MLSHFSGDCCKFSSGEGRRGAHALVFLGAKACHFQNRGWPLLHLAHARQRTRFTQHARDPNSSRRPLRSKIKTGLLSCVRVEPWRMPESDLRICNINGSRVESGSTAVSVTAHHALPGALGRGRGPSAMLARAAWPRAEGASEPRAAADAAGDHLRDRLWALHGRGGDGVRCYAICKTWRAVNHGTFTGSTACSRHAHGMRSQDPPKKVSSTRWLANWLVGKFSGSFCLWVMSWPINSMWPLFPPF